MTKQYLKRTWVNAKLISGKSKIHGEGVFTKSKIKKGEKLMEFGGDSISEKEALSGDYRTRSVWIVSPNNYLALPETDSEESLDEYLNHSCDANSWLSDEVTLIAKRDIGVGEEITLDQGTWNFEYDEYTDNEELCSCGSENCRKVLTKNDWKIRDLQKKYKGHFHPMIQELISKR